MIPSEEPLGYLPLDAWADKRIPPFPGVAVMLVQPLHTFFAGYHALRSGPSGMLVQPPHTFFASIHALRRGPRGMLVQPSHTFFADYHALRRIG